MDIIDTDIKADQAEKAFAQLEARLLAIPRDRLQEPRINPKRAAQAAVQVARVLRQPEIRERFVELAAKGKFDLQLLDDLGVAAGAVWHARDLHEKASEASHAAQVPLPIFQDATTMRARMLKVLDYHIGDDPAIAARLAAIRGGKGHQDLASDLTALADLYRQHQAQLADDHRHYRAGDEEGARQAAEAIAKVLATSAPDVAHWTDMQSRAWTLLHQTYEEIRRAGHFLFYYEEPEELFPSLSAAARSARAAT